MSVYYSFGRVSDAKVIELMDSLLTLFKVSSATVSVGDLASFTMKKTETDIEASEDRAALESVLTADSYLITVMQWSTANSTHLVSYRRQKIWGQNIHQQQTWIDSPNRYMDSIEIESTPQNAPPLLSLVRKYVDMSPPIVAGGETGSVLDQSQEILNRVSSAVATLVEHTSARQKSLDATRTSLAREADKAIIAGRAEAAEEVKRIEQAYEVKEAVLAAREDELDDRANTHVRREFAKKMADLSDTQLKENLLTKSQKSFWIPLVICIIPIAILAYVVSSELGFISVFGESIGKLAADTKLNAEQKNILIGNVNYQILYAQIRIVLQSLGIAALVWFALRLASSRYSLVSGWERDLHRFRLDTERAGFLVEGDLEARKVNQQGLPDVLLESFSRNLFASSDSAHGPTSSEGLGGALNALLGQAAKVRVGPDGVNVEVEGKGIRKARKLIEDE